MTSEPLYRPNKSPVNCNQVPPRIPQAGNNWQTMGRQIENNPERIEDELPPNSVPDPSHRIRYHKKESKVLGSKKRNRLTKFNEKGEEMSEELSDCSDLSSQGKC